MRGQVSRYGMRWAAIAVMVGMLASACGGGGGESSSDGPVETTGPVSGTGGPADTSSFDDVIRVTPHLDDAAATQGWIGLEGGTLSVESADGATFTLDVPPDSVRMPVQITMTPVSSIDDLPFGDGSSHAVDLQPNGLIFDVPARLTISPPTPIEVGEQLPFTYQGSAVILARPVMDSSDVAIEVDHFSGYGVAKGLLGDVEEVRHRLGEDALQRINNEMRALLLERRARELAGEEPDPAGDQRLQELFDQFEREVLAPRMAAAGESCAAGRLAAETYMGWARTAELLGFEPSVGDGYGPLIDTVTTVCMEEEYEMCVDHHVVHRIPVIYYASQRSAALVGAPSEDVLARARQQLEDCLRFELEMEVSSIGEVEWPNMSVRSEDTATWTTEANFDAGRLEFTPTTEEMESGQPAYDVVATGCVVGTPEPWSAPAKFVLLRWSPTEYVMTEELGDIELLEVVVDLPDVPIHVPSMVCGGVDGGAFDDPVSAAAIFRAAHPDGVVPGWKVLGDEQFAVAEWDTTLETPVGTMRSLGFAELRHTPR